MRDTFNRILRKILSEKRFKGLNDKDASLIEEAVETALKAGGDLSTSVIYEILKEKDED